MAALQRTACFGTCPVYSLRIYSDGTVIYRGEWHVLVRGGRKKQLSAQTLGAIVEFFRKVGFLDLAYQCGEWSTDSPTTSIFFSDAGRSRLLRHYHGCSGAPRGLNDLEDEIDRLVGSSSWIGKMDGSAPLDLDSLEPPLAP